MNFAAFFLSTGRCGTQWIADALSGVYSDLVDVEHEPLDDRYEARRVLAGNGSGELPAAVLKHFDGIEARLESRSYVECGHPNWSVIPHLADRFRARVRIVHLTRHPVPTSWSWLTHRAFVEPILPHLRPKVLLSPFDAGVKFPEYQQTWERLSPFEKCLYYWSEVHAFALDLQSRTDARWLRLGFEDLFRGDGLERLLDFLDLPQRDSIFARKSRKFDKHTFLAEPVPDWRIIENHPRVLAIADELGYRMDVVDETAMRSRYEVPATFLGNG